ncbi:hypothetical protein [Tateyamaria sp. Alg231-49]|uniref:hypothetical protein n=1 Tax=Tateyamaria sp. Alg231-49 TaxID=1922219 RepID=UPI000D558BA6|nr:hypothetical protein [Tateyamaria sp. Alg231-49]
MGKAVIGIIGLVIGAVLGTVFGGAAMTGTAAGLGVASGLNAGICATVQAAENERLLSPEQVDQVLTRAASDLMALQGREPEGDILGTSAHCEKVMADLAEAAKN